MTALKAETTPDSRLRHAWIELTHQCNLECLHCYTESGPSVSTKSPLTFVEYRKLLGELRNNGCNSIQFIGGEPTLNRHLPTLIALSRQLEFDAVEVFSNLLHLSEELLTTLTRHGISIACSYYSDLSSVHDEITQRAGSHSRTVNNISRVLAAGLSLRVGIIVMDGINDSRLAETQRHLRSLGVNAITVDHVRAFGRGQVLGDPQGCDLSALCGACANGSICVDPDGLVSPCIMSRGWQLGSFRETPVSDLVRSPKLREFTAALNAAHQNAVHASNSGCNPSDCSPNSSCNPGACSPQIGGPPGCSPHGHCAPEHFINVR